jgi:transcriptional regulator NrdR family protein
VKCVYCGEVEASRNIIDPNMMPEDKELKTWDVCATCDEVIQSQQMLALGELLKFKHDGRFKDLGEKMVEKAQEKLDEIAEETKTPIYTAKLTRNGDKYDVEETLTLGKPKKEGE